MIYIDGIGYVDESKYYASSNSAVNNSADFDSLLEAETTIYATPESNGLTTDATKSTTASAPVTAPKELENIFKEASSKYNVSERLLKAVAKAESNFNTSAVSSAGAIGVMQLMPSTAASLGVTNPYDATQNIMGGAKLLSQLLNKYNGNTSLSLAAYNAGSGNVDKYNGIPPFSETQNYVKKVLGYLSGYEDTNNANTVYAAASNSFAGQVYTVHATPDPTLAPVSYKNASNRGNSDTANTAQTNPVSAASLASSITSAMEAQALNIMNKDSDTISTSNLSSTLISALSKIADTEAGTDAIQNASKLFDENGYTYQSYVNLLNEFTDIVGDMGNTSSSTTGDEDNYLAGFYQYDLTTGNLTNAKEVVDNGLGNNQTSDILSTLLNSYAINKSNIDLF